MQLVVETAGVTDELACRAPPPQAGGGRPARRTLTLTLLGHELRGQQHSHHLVGCECVCDKACVCLCVSLSPLFSWASAVAGRHSSPAGCSHCTGGHPSPPSSTGGRCVSRSEHTSVARPGDEWSPSTNRTPCGGNRSGQGAEPQRGLQRSGAGC